MCTSFTPTRSGRWVAQHFGTDLPQETYPEQAYPGYPAPIARLDAAGQVTVHTARFGLIPHWAKDAKTATQISRKTYNARSETVAEKPSYRTPWRKRQFAIALLDDFFEPSWETGQAERWRIRRSDGEPMGVASIWDQWVEPGTGEVVETFSMLTVNADGHPVMGRFHRPGDEKRSVVVLEPESFVPFLTSNGVTARTWMTCPDAGALTATTVHNNPAV